MRKREIDIIFKAYPDKHFKSALEMGAGDGFQSKLLFRYTKRLISTDFDPNRLRQQDQDGIQYKICDAELIDTYFNGETFDLIFSSNLFEHLPNVDNALLRIKSITQPDSLVVLIMPSPFWALCHFFLYYPVKIYDFGKKRFRKIEKKSNKIYKAKVLSSLNRGNNLKALPLTRPGFLNKIRWPQPHGVSNTNFEELIKFRKKFWCAKFKSNGFKIIDIKKGPVMSGYGFQLDRIRAVLERLGFAGEYIYYLSPIIPRSLSTATKKKV